MLLIVGGENVTIKSLSISQWNDHRDNREHCKEREVKNLMFCWKQFSKIWGSIYLHQQTAMMYLVVILENTTSQ